MKVGIIGLGDIAQKAYLPVMTGIQGVEWVLSTRNESVLEQIKDKYRITQTAQTIEKLIETGIHAAFVHTSTESHPAIIESLLNAGIHVYVDKPIAYTYEQAKTLTELAHQKNCVLMTGFNRRFAPMVSALKEVKDRTYIYMEKNRIHQPDYARRFIFDDFIHVVDTISYLSPGTVRDVSVSPKIQDGMLVQVMIKLEGDDYTSVGFMNRDSGITEERLEVISSGQKHIIRDLNTTIHFSQGEEKHRAFGDWEPVLKRRGFDDIIASFLKCVMGEARQEPSMEEALETHRLCEIIVKKAEENGAIVWKL
ncbi:virulence factor [Paenibacillus uliginis N3/975]|uniref:Virulence factor n=1 Tax=Paenibacillus uliginis N3/975 TaxID=1313296 RepID=A0A1X7H9Q8_9BACL|nr:Gfo/Idh/MocA family oxidoreductase [Paenibacillus uliginis]SMF82325.1 virulence factor [Paenibacillus uliginis N3/975]